MRQTLVLGIFKPPFFVKPRPITGSSGVKTISWIFFEDQSLYFCEWHCLVSLTWISLGSYHVCLTNYENWHQYFFCFPGMQETGVGVICCRSLLTYPCLLDVCEVGKTIWYCLGRGHCFTEKHKVRQTDPLFPILFNTLPWSRWSSSKNHYLNYII